MLRITEMATQGKVSRLRLDGRIDLESFAELEAAWARLGAPNGSALILDMAGVEYMSAEIARKLAKLSGESFHIINCSPFIETLLDTQTFE